MSVVIAGLILACAAPAQDRVLAASPEEPPWVPDLRNPGRRIEIPLDRRLEVVLLGDGYLEGERERFERDVRNWYERFLTYVPWREFRGAFRVRAYWTPSASRASRERRSYYGIAATPFDVGDVAGPATRAAIFRALELLDATRVRAAARLTHTTVVMLVLNERGTHPSGLAREISSPDGSLTVAAGFAADPHHEFGHAYGGLRDEYIRVAGLKADRKPPERLSLYNVSNIAYTKERRLLPWAHLSPGSPLNPDPDSVIGVLWIGGVLEEGAWHSEARCLMNGTHDNWTPDRTRRGARLRDPDRFCFWCEEILVARTFHRTGQLGDSTDGEELWKRWEELRPHYHKAFDVPTRIRIQNELDARAGLREARIYERPVP